MLAYLGPSGTFSHTAAKQYIQKKGIKTDIREYSSIYAAIKSVEDGDSDMVIAPIENSIEGSINVTLDALAFDMNLFITDEHILKVEQNILIKPGTEPANIKKILSHAQAIGQCSGIIAREFPDCRIESVNSTSYAAQKAAEGDGSIAAIGSAEGAALYGLQILRKNCGDSKDNRTRFVIISKNASSEVTGNDKTSIVFTLPQDVPGGLCRAITVFAEADINILKIESRPIKTELGKYVFFLDIAGNIQDPVVYAALEGIRQNVSFYKYLGSYADDNGEERSVL